MAQKLYSNIDKYSESWNFGPNENDVKPVDWILDRMISKWPNSSWKLDHHPKPHEAGFLKLDITKAESKLDWKPTWNLNIALEKVINWQKAWRNKEDIQSICFSEINEYMKDMSHENA